MQSFAINSFLVFAVRIFHLTDMMFYHSVPDCFAS